MTKPEDHSSLPSYVTLEKQLAQITRVTRPSYADLFAQMEKALQPFRAQHLCLAQQMTAISHVASLNKIVTANEQLMSAFDRIRLDTQSLADMAKVHTSWIQGLQPLQESFDHLLASAKLKLTACSQMATIAERFCVGVDFDRLQRTFNIQDDIVAQLQRRVNSINTSFETLAASVESLPSLTSLPSFLMPSATREVMLTGYALAEMSPEGIEAVEASDAEVLSEVRQDVSGVGRLLAQVDPALERMYRGAHEALRSGNVERGRHVLTSLREIWGHLLRHIAPDEEVLRWVADKGRELLHEGRPTRRDRVLYVCRTVNHEPLSDFLAVDTRALVKLVEFLNRVHELEPGLTDEQLSAVLLRTESWLTFIIQVSQEALEC